FLELAKTLQDLAIHEQEAAGRELRAPRHGITPRKPLEEFARGHTPRLVSTRSPPSPDNASTLSPFFGKIENNLGRILEVAGKKGDGLPSDMHQPRAESNVRAKVTREPNPLKTYVAAADLSNDFPALISAAVIHKQHAEIKVGMAHEPLSDRRFVET